MIFLKVFIKAAATIFTAMFVLGGVFVVFFFWQVDPYQWKAPSDKKLIAMFQQHQPEFEKLERMAAEDVRRGFALEADPENAKVVKTVSRTRREEYKRLLSQIDSDLYLTMDDSYEGLELRFIAAQGGAGPIGDDWMKGIEYLPVYSKQEGKIVPSLEKGYQLPEDDYLRPIQPNWYVFYSVY